ncbi:MAG: hypothetical protein RJA57_1873, partial [Bacteroidota bacterium]
SDDGTFILIAEYGGWWSSTEADTNNAWYRALSYGRDRVGRYNDREGGGKGLSVRCLRD